MLRRWAIRIGIACVGLFIFVSWFRVPSRGGDAKRQAPLSVSEDSIDEKKSSARAKPARIVKSVVGVVAALATLVFAYLAVAVNAHWFPWETKIPSVTMNLDGKEPHDTWYSMVNQLINFFNFNYARSTHLNLGLTNFKIIESGSRAESDFENGQTEDVLYKNPYTSSAAITAIYLGAECGNSANCISLTLNLVAGPGSNLGYVTQNAAGFIAISGYYQIGATACQTGTCNIDLIPIEPPM